MALITTHTIDTDGTAPTFGAAASGDTAETGPRVFLVVKNTDAATVDVTIASQITLASGDAYPAKVYTVAATTGENWIPLIADYGNDSKEAEISYEATANVTRAVVKI